MTYMTLANTTQAKMLLPQLNLYCAYPKFHLKKYLNLIRVVFRRYSLKVNLCRHFLQKSSKIKPNFIRMVFTKMVTELITPGELFFADGATKRSLNYVLDRLKLAPALSCIHHHLYLQETSCNLKQVKNVQKNCFNSFFLSSRLSRFWVYFFQQSCMKK